MLFYGIAKVCNASLQKTCALLNLDILFTPTHKIYKNWYSTINYEPTVTRSSLYLEQIIKVPWMFWKSKVLLYEII